MNSQDYISSGIIENYLLGQLSGKECAEVDAMAKKNPEVKAEIETVEKTLMDFSAVPPPPHLKAAILSKLEIKEAKIIPIENKRNSSILWLAAASIALLIISGIYNFNMMNKLKTAEDQLAVLNSEKEKTTKEYESQTASYQSMAKQMAIMMQPENKKVMMKGMGPAPDAIAAIYWNQSTKDVYINVNVLPVPAADKQYQLWAIVDGKPVDEGMLDMSDATPLHKMKPVSGAQAFAVTLEKKGGNPSPTMSAMYLLGNV